MQTLFFHLDQYVLGVKASMRCPSGFSVLNDEDACRTYATTRGLKWGGTYCWTTEAPGCFKSFKNSNPLKAGAEIRFSTCNESYTVYDYAAVCTKGDFLVLNMYIYNSNKFII